MAHYRNSANKQAYAIHRMSVAIDRMLGSGTDDSKRRAARWAKAWGIASSG
jgi:hypothetical protein